jgi:hypothetical protein
MCARSGFGLQRSDSKAAPSSMDAHIRIIQNSQKLFLSVRTMPSHRVQVEINGLHSHTKLDDISHHIRSHSRGLKGSQIQGSGSIDI